MFLLLVSGCFQGPWAWTLLLEMFPAQDSLWEQASDWLNYFVDGGEETKKRVDQLGFALNGQLNPSSFTLCIGLWEVFDTVLIKIFQVNPKPFVCWTARFKRDLCGWRAKLRDWIMMTEFLLDLASCTTGHAALGVHNARQPADERDTAVQRLLLPSGHFEMEKWWPNFCLISQATWHGAALHVLSAGQPDDERVKAVSKTRHNTLLSPLPSPPSQSSCDGQFRS